MSGARCLVTQCLVIQCLVNGSVAPVLSMYGDRSPSACQGLTKQSLLSRYLLGLGSCIGGFRGGSAASPSFPGWDTSS